MDAAGHVISGTVQVCVVVLIHACLPHASRCHKCPGDPVGVNAPSL